MVIKFPDNFLWGAATASYQVEGYPLENGAGMSTWHTFSHTPGNTVNGDTGDIACDHYHKYSEDITLMKSLGLKAYRFSIAWPRIFPSGTGKVNLKGIDFYDKLIDELLDANIIPFVTLYHWDLPQALQDRGGWANKEIVGWYADYVDFIFQKLGDRVKNWITLNEPWIVSFYGHFYGTDAPGMKNVYTAFTTFHNQLKAHSKAVEIFRQENMDGKIGVSLSNNYYKPATTNEEDILATQRMHAFANYSLFLDPVFFGRYPKILQNVIETYLPRDYEKDLDEIKREIDFVGINYYRGHSVKYDKSQFLDAKLMKIGLKETGIGWEIFPRGLYEILNGVQKEYKPKELYVTENGSAFEDKVINDHVHDDERIEFLRDHLIEANNSIKEGVNLKGYFVWSLMDNFEWAYGYSKRFGIIYVDYKTQKRIVKDSGIYYSKIIKNGGILKSEFNLE